MPPRLSHELPYSPTATRQRPRHGRWRRRDLLEIGFSTALGLSLPAVARRSLATPLAGNQVASGARAKNALLVFLFGGPSQIDTFDIKPDAPIEYRSQFAAIDTKLPGVQVCEHLPQMAARLDRCALVRTMHCHPNFGDHRLAVHAMLGGLAELPPGAGLPASRKDWPTYAAVFEYLRPRRDGLPTSAVLPGQIIDPGTGLYPGQNSGLLGAAFDPYRFDRDPNAKDYQVDPALVVPAGASIERLVSKRDLLSQFDRQRSELFGALETVGYTSEQQEAFGVLAAGGLAQALDIEREGAERRERYGRHLFGQSLLLAKRLLEAGIPVVQANVSYQALWDTHYNNFVGLKAHLPPLDRALSALIDDMSASGLLDETLLVVMGEFGRTPKLVLPKPTDPSHFTSPGRDHWMDCFWAIFAGAGVRGGQVIGRSDAVAAYPLTTAFDHADVGATVYAALGVDPATQLRDMQGRPLTLNHGRVIEPLYTAEEV